MKKIACLSVFLFACSSSSSPSSVENAKPAVEKTPAPEVGQANIAIRGCLKEAADDPAADAKFPVAQTRSATPEVDVKTGAGGVTVAHQFAHACCLKGAVETKVEAGKVVLIETLSGTPCRCMCSSTIETAVKLESGDYELEVQLVRDGKSNSVHSGKITVP